MSYNPRIRHRHSTLGLFVGLDNILYEFAHLLQRRVNLNSFVGNCLTLSREPCHVSLWLGGVIAAGVFGPPSVIF